MSWLLYLLRVNRGFFVFGLVVFAGFYAASARAESWVGPFQYDTQAMAACIEAGAEVSPTYECADLGPQPNPISNEVGCYYKHLPNAYTAFCFLEFEPTSDRCSDLQADTEDPGSVNFNDPDNRQTESAESRCIGGCTWRAQGAFVRVTTDSVLASVEAHFGYDGTDCATTPATPSDAPPPDVPPKPTEPLCIAAASGQSYCTTQDGKQCYALRSQPGKSICWNAGETGVKTDGATAQVRGPGTGTPGAPTPPPGETFQSAADTTHTSEDHVGDTTTTTTTTITNYNTTNGTNAGNVNQGQPTPGSGSGGSTSGPDGAVSGIGNCDAQPTCSGPAVECAAFIEEHKAACALGKIGGDMSSAETGVLNSNGNGTGENPASADAAGLHESNDYDTGDLDETGFLTGGRSCPVVSAVMFYGVSVPMPNSVLCSWLSIGSYLILAFAGLACLRIIRGSA